MLTLQKEKRNYDKKDYLVNGQTTRRRRSPLSSEEEEEEACPQVHSPLVAS